HIPHLVQRAYPTHGIHNCTDLEAHVVHELALLLTFFPYIQSSLSYCTFVIGANFASNRLIPVGLGKAISNSFDSPSPFTLTTVPIPHFLCSALSPTFQPISSPPVDVITGLANVFLSAGRLGVDDGL